MKTIKNNLSNEIIIKNSRFICLLIKINNIDISDILNNIKLSYPKATHYCYGFIYNNYKKSSDDGEPTGTAGNSILFVLEKNNLNNEIKRINNQITKLKSESIKTEQEKNLLLSNQTKIENNIKEIKIQLEEYNNQLIELKNKDKELDSNLPDSLSVDDNNKQIIEMQKK